MGLKDMIVGKFEGVLDSNKKTIYIVVENLPKPLAKTIANTHFKVKMSDLCTQEVYMDNLDSEEFSFEEYPQAIKAIAVYKRKN